jgi:hypothetical protein
VGFLRELLRLTCFRNNNLAIEGLQTFLINAGLLNVLDKELIEFLKRASGKESLYPILLIPMSMKWC